LGIAVAEGIERFIDELGSTNAAERSLVDVCGLLVGLLKRTAIKDTWLVHLLSVMYFAISHLAHFHALTMSSTIASLSVIARQVLVVIISDWSSFVRAEIGRVSRLRLAFERYRKLFNVLSIPDPVWEEIVRYMLALTDYFATNSCIFDLETITVNSAVFVEAFPAYEWPLITGLDFIVRNADDIVAGKLPIKRIPAELQHGWLSLVLNKMKEAFGREYPERKLAAVANTDPVVPTVQPIEKFVDLNSVFATVQMAIPSPLPSLSLF
jgi:hypothetical protein